MVCECGIPWTFLLPFLSINSMANTDNNVCLLDVFSIYFLFRFEKKMFLFYFFFIYFFFFFQIN